jgi:hypothetical protein
MRVSPAGLLMAFAIPLAVAGLAAVLLVQAGPHAVRLIGIPDDHLELLAIASHSEADVSEKQAIETAIRSAGAISEGGVRDIALGRYSEEPVTIDSGRLVWVISLVPDKSAPVFITGDIGYDHSCDWAVHYDWVVAYVDAKTGGSLGYGTGASFDPSLPPTFVSSANSDREYCKRLFEGARRAVRSP